MEKSNVSYVLGGIVDIRDFAAFNSNHGRTEGDRLLHQLKQLFSRLVSVGIHTLSGDGDEIVFWTEELEMPDLRNHILEIERQLRGEHLDFHMWCGFSRMRKDTFNAKSFYQLMNQSLHQIKLSNKAMHGTPKRRP